MVIAEGDFAEIPVISGTSDRVFRDGKNCYVEEIRSGNRLVAFDSMRKKKGAWQT